MKPNTDDKNITTWKSYEEVAVYLLNEFRHEFGLEHVEGKQELTGETTEHKIDAKGVKEGNQGFVIVECRQYRTSRQNKGKLCELAYRIEDTGAVGGMIVSPLGIQEGAAKIANKENITSVRLDANSTTTQYIMKFLNKVMVGICDNIVLSDTCSIEVFPKCSRCGKLFQQKLNDHICPGCEEVAE